MVKTRLLFLLSLIQNRKRHIIKIRYIYAIIYGNKKYCL